MPGFLKLRGLRACERGNAALVSAATLPLLISSAALAYDTVQLALWNHQLQGLADRGALAGARALSQRLPVRPAVERSVTGDADVRLVAAPLVEAAAGGDPRSIRVVITSQRRLPVFAALLAEPPTRSAEAIATYVRRPVGDPGDPIQLLGPQ